MSKPLARDTASRTNAWPKRLSMSCFSGGTRAFPRYMFSRGPFRCVQRCELGSRSDGVCGRGAGSNVVTPRPGGSDRDFTFLGYFHGFGYFPPVRPHHFSFERRYEIR